MRELAILLMWVTAATVGFAEDIAPTAQQIQAWVSDLSADRYETRDRATQSLVAAGAAAIEPLLEGLAEHGLEVTTRGIYVLQQLAVAGDVATEDAARGALEKIAAARVTAAARHAQEALTKLDALRQQRALEELARLGAVIDREHIELGLPVGPILAVEINDQWKGTRDDLRWLGFLRDVEQVTFVGPAVTDEWLGYLANLDRVVVLKIKRASITEEGLKSLQELDGLQYVKLLYMPIGDEAVQHLAQCRRIISLYIFGSRLTAEGQARLSAALGAKVDRRKGAFLGISPTVADNAAWQILSVTEKSAAARAGLRPGDTVVSYGGQPVTDFASLTALISEDDAGETVTLEIVRDTQVFERRVTLGEWD